MVEFDFLTLTTYQVRCEGCGTSSGERSTEEGASLQAKGLGFVAVETPEDGTLNFCAVCYRNLEKPQPQASDARLNSRWRYFK